MNLPDSLLKPPRGPGFSKPTKPDLNVSKLSRAFKMLRRNNFASFDLWKVGHGAPGGRRSNLSTFELGRSTLYAHTRFIIVSDFGAWSKNQHLVHHWSIIGLFLQQGTEKSSIFLEKGTKISLSPVMACWGNQGFCKFRVSLHFFLGKF
jgi:hypothetical protein